MSGPRVTKHPQETDSLMVSIFTCLEGGAGQMASCGFCNSLIPLLPGGRSIWVSSLMAPLVCDRIPFTAARWASLATSAGPLLQPTLAWTSSSHVAHSPPACFHTRCFSRRVKYLAVILSEENENYTLLFDLGLFFIELTISIQSCDWLLCPCFGHFATWKWTVLHKYQKFIIWNI